MMNLDIPENIFRALSDKSRHRIIIMLQIKPLCVCEMAEVLKLAPSTVLIHLSILSEEGLIKREKDGKWINYKIILSPFENQISSLLIYLMLVLEYDAAIKNCREIISTVERNVL
ncbi:MAG TPA: metalloregulator ArsR/SmtB family transcription factor [Ignavibacteria bacterium]|nr:metalloregulator ArsR/SmtB family transcription factor [Ignavibacteria bacterium]